MPALGGKAREGGWLGYCNLRLKFEAGGVEKGLTRLNLEIWKKSSLLNHFRSLRNFQEGNLQFFFGFRVKRCYSNRRLDYCNELGGIS